MGGRGLSTGMHQEPLHFKDSRGSTGGKAAGYPTFRLSWGWRFLGLPHPFPHFPELLFPGALMPGAHPALHILLAVG